MLLFEKSREGRGCAILPECDVPVVPATGKDERKQPLHMPALSEPAFTPLYGAGSQNERRQRRFLSAGFLHYEIQPRESMNRSQH